MARSLSAILLHVIFSTKDRAPLIKDNVSEELHEYIGGILRGKNCQPLTVGGVSDHIHFLADFVRDTSVSDVVKEVKRCSSIWIKGLENANPEFAWQGGYGAFSVSASHAQHVSFYIQKQKEHHKNVSFQEEYLSILKKYGISYDDRFLWD